MEKQEAATRNSLQLPRRLFHMSMGVSITLLYGFFLEHDQAVFILSTFACALYLFEQFRINYPEYADKFKKLTQTIYRAEEKLKESAAIPYIMAILFTILIFPKIIAISAILTLAIADPMSAIVGIKWGKIKMAPNKSLEGSGAFFLSTFFIIFLVFLIGTSSLASISAWRIFFFAAITSFLCSVLESFPIKIDDNITIPLFTSVCLWIFGHIFGLFL